MAPPMHSHLASCGDHLLRRRSNVACNSLQFVQAINEHFAKVDRNGDGKLNQAELLSFVMSLTTLEDPKNDIDAICSAIDTDNDGFVSKEEFTAFLSPFVAKFESGHKELDIEEIIKRAFRAVIADGKRQRDIVIEAFMSSSKELPKASLQSTKWMHQAYEDFYQAPASKDAPIYQTKRIAFLKEALKRTIAECDNPKQMKPSLDCKSFDNAPDRGTFQAFCSLWLKKISSVQEAGSSSPLQPGFFKKGPINGSFKGSFKGPFTNSFTGVVGLGA